jgi:hypothetical protein
MPEMEGIELEGIESPERSLRSDCGADSQPSHRDYADQHGRDEPRGRATAANLVPIRCVASAMRWSFRDVGVPGLGHSA